MSDEAPVLPRPHWWRTALIGGGLIVAAFGGAAVMRWWQSAPAAPTASAARPSRPIVQIVRQQAGLPDLSDLVDRACPAAAMIVAAGATLPATAPASAAPAMRLSDDGWLLTAAGNLPKGDLEAVFGNGVRSPVIEVRTDPVSGLTLAKAAQPQGTPADFSDGPPPRAGQFGLAVATPAGLGCSADLAMVESDFLADGGAQSGYFRLAASASDWPAGMAVLGSDGRIIGMVAGGGPSAAAIPASIASLIADELLRGSLSPTTAFGFRAIDFGGALATRLGDVRSGAGVALVQPGSKTASAGLQAGDIVTNANGQPVSSASELGRVLDAGGATVPLTVQRRDQKLTITVFRQS